MGSLAYGSKKYRALKWVRYLESRKAVEQISSSYQSEYLPFEEDFEMIGKNIEQKYQNTKMTAHAFNMNYNNNFYRPYTL